MPRGGMSGEATHCQNFENVGKSSQLSINAGEYLVVEINEIEAIVRMPASISALVIMLGDKDPNVEIKASVSETTDNNGVYWSN